MNKAKKTIMALVLSLGGIATVVAEPVQLLTPAVAVQYGQRDRDRDRTVDIVGDYTGYNTLYKSEIHLKVSPNGHLKAVITLENGRKVHQKGWLGDGWITIDKNRYRIERQERDRDFTLVQENDRDNRIEFHPDH